MTDDINELAERIHSISTSKGFAPPDLTNLPEKLMLAVSELSEALEEHRSNKPLVYFDHEEGCPMAPPLNHDHGCGCRPKPEGVAVEIGDAVIRCLHMLQSLLDQEEPFGYNVSEVLNLKVDYNAGRPAMHGRAY